MDERHRKSDYPPEFRWVLFGLFIALLVIAAILLAIAWWIDSYFRGI